MKKQEEPNVAPGNVDFLLQKAAKEDQKKGEVTKVTSLGFDRT